MRKHCLDILLCVYLNCKYPCFTFFNMHFERECTFTQYIIFSSFPPLSQMLPCFIYCDRVQALYQRRLLLQVWMYILSSTTQNRKAAQKCSRCLSQIWCVLISNYSLPVVEEDLHFPNQVKVQILKVKVPDLRFYSSKSTKVSFFKCTLSKK